MMLVSIVGTRPNGLVRWRHSMGQPAGSAALPQPLRCFDRPLPDRPGSRRSRSRSVRRSTPAPLRRTPTHRYRRRRRPIRYRSQRSCCQLRSTLAPIVRTASRRCDWAPRRPTLPRRRRRSLRRSTPHRALHTL
jgi:hypothetical protein